MNGGNVPFAAMTVTLREAWTFCVLRPCPMKLGAAPAVKDLLEMRWGAAATGSVAIVLIAWICV